MRPGPILALVGRFAIFNGHVHGAEMPQDGSGSAYAAGFLSATALLHCAGAALGVRIARFGKHSGWRITQAAGGAMAISRLAILSGVA